MSSAASTKIPGRLGWHREINSGRIRRNTFAWVDGRIGYGLNDRNAVLELYESINRLRRQVHLDLVWVPRAANLAGRYIEKKVGL